MMKRFLLPLIILFCASPASAQESPPIADNSFLIEEAYNQERGVVQHISTFMRQRNGEWAYSFTQEWPAPSMKHQLSYTIPVQQFNGSGFRNRGVGDIGLNYRYQLVGTAKLAIAPRFSLLLLTGDSQREMGAGALGYEVNLPVSVRHGKRLVTHWNAGATFTPEAKNALGEEANTVGYNLGQSFVVLALLNFNVMFETVWNRNEAVIGPRLKEREYSLYLNPGVRWAHNFKNGLQIVPGVAVPVGVGPSRGERGLFFYISFEHPFEKEK